MTLPRLGAFVDKRSTFDERYLRFMVSRRWFSKLVHAACAGLAGLLAQPISAQDIDIGLYPTAVPDSFEVRLVSNGVDYDESLVSTVFTLRWESAAGGVLNNSDVASPCPALHFFNVGGVVDVGDYSYATFDILSLHPLGSDCFISTTGTVIGGIRIRELNGCRQVGITDDPYVQNNNLGYFISVGGLERTGAILTNPMETGPCAPCVPPQITSLTGDTLVWFCTSGPIALTSSVTGGPVTFSWTGPHPFNPQGNSHWYTGPGLELSIARLGTYTLTVTNDCGADSASVTVSSGDTAGCVPPDIIDLIYSLPAYPCGTVSLLAELTYDDGCTLFQWSGPVTMVGNTTSMTVANALPGDYQLRATNACGSDSMSIQVDLDTVACVPPEILDILTSGFDCSSPLMLTAQMVPNAACAYYSWTGPVEVPDGTTPSSVVFDAVSGEYQLAVSNACGSDTLTLAVALDSVADCIPPVITSMSDTSFSCAVIIYYEVTGSDCGRLLDWSGPATIYDQTSYASVPDPISGEYQLLVTNACGSDSLSIAIELDTTGCTPPRILGIGNNAACNPGLSLNAQMAPSDDCVSHVWSGPVEIADGSAYVQVTGAVPGVYQLVSINACGSDTFSLALDSLGWSVVPNILGMNTNGPICEGDTLILTAQVSDPNANFTWTAAPDFSAFSWGLPPLEVPDGSPTLIVPNAPAGYNYYLTMTNDCGSDTEYRDGFVISDSGRTIYTCSWDTYPFNMTAHDPYYQYFGTWSHDGEPHAATYDPTVDSPGIYYFHATAGCEPIPITVVELDTTQNGTNGAITLCSTDEPVDLFTLIGGEPDAPGFWDYGLGGYFSGIYDPASNNPNIYRYRAYCSLGNSALITVTELGADTLYLDLDEDGLGDPGSSIIGCDSLAYASNPDDACPDVFGTIGSSCDDGIESTVNDIIQEDCTCVGELSTSIDMHTAGHLSIWPNPGAGPWTISLPVGQPTLSAWALHITDALGRTVLERSLDLAVAGGGQRSFAAPGLVSGVYLVRVRASGQEFTRRLVVR